MASWTDSLNSIYPSQEPFGGVPHGGPGQYKPYEFISISPTNQKPTAPTGPTEGPLLTTGTPTIDLYPATSNSNQNSTAQHSSQSTSSNQSSSNSSSFNNTDSQSTSNSYNGLPSAVRDQYLSWLMPMLQEQVQGLPNIIDEQTNNALGMYQQILQNSLREYSPAMFGNLANRGILSSQVATDAISEALRKSIQDSASKGYETAMRAATMKANIPSMLMGAVDTGKYSQSDQQSTSTGRSASESSAQSTGQSQSTSQGTSNSNASSSSIDPSAMYNYWANIF